MKRPPTLIIPPASIDCISALFYNTTMEQPSNIIKTYTSDDSTKVNKYYIESRRILHTFFEYRQEYDPDDDPTIRYPLQEAAPSDQIQTHLPPEVDAAALDDAPNE